ncbi:hypothetical protein ACWDUL_20255 [Nocardia niigatensis]
MSQPNHHIAGLPTVPPSGSVEFTHVADEHTGLALSRALVLARWRSPAGWAMLAAIPLILMAKHALQVISGAVDSETPVLDFIRTYLVLLAATAVIALVITALQWVRCPAAVRAYAKPGSSMTIRYFEQSFEIELVTRTIRVDYAQIRELTRVGEAMYLRVKGGPALALPQELFTYHLDQSGPR